ncbi:hypothetical protein DY000_02021541 [Brassica cretica]|uniref:Uncharacterized protein n=1 Tax=Brassica cretica TaxID=69181 RepID=A0ABQ7E0X8_BRACR|nr:hypothetical protein DY000_02021541 [Brassica cretica]
MQSLMVKVRGLSEPIDCSFLEVLERHPKLKGGDCRCIDQMGVLIQMQVQQRMEQSLQQRSVRTDEQVKMKIAT